MSTVSRLSLLCFALPLAACQPPRPAWEPGHASTPDRARESGRTSRERPVEAKQQAEVVGVEASITRIGTGEVIAVSRGRMRADGVFSFETNKGGDAAGSRFTVHVEPERNATFTANVQWNETTADGREVRWSPNLALTDGAESVSEIAWADGDGRRLTLKLTRDPLPAALASAAPAMSDPHPAPNQEPAAPATGVQ
jgi:hypothetical protein